jgi:copper(I)-binding protein
VVCAAFVVVAGLAVLGACGDDVAPVALDPSQIQVRDAVVAVPAGANTALYLAVENTGSTGDRLLDVRTDAGATTELHETKAGDDGLMRMHHVDAVELPAGATVDLVPGGLHVMIYDARRLVEGDTVTVELVLERAGVVQLEARVGTYTELLGD